MGWLIDLITRLVAMLFHRPAPTPPQSRVEIDTERAAVAETKLATVTQSAKAEASIAQAVTDAPKDVQGVVEELRKGEF